VKQEHKAIIAKALNDIRQANKDVAAVANDPATTQDEARQIADAFAEVDPDAQGKLADILYKDDNSDASDEEMLEAMFGT
jgi:hypothetical protein